MTKKYNKRRQNAKANAGYPRGRVRPPVPQETSHLSDSTVSYADAEHDSASTSNSSRYHSPSPNTRGDTSSASYDSNGENGYYTPDDQDKTRVEIPEYKNTHFLMLLNKKIEEITQRPKTIFNFSVKQKLKRVVQAIEDFNDDLTQAHELYYNRLLEAYIGAKEAISLLLELDESQDADAAALIDFIHFTLTVKLNVLNQMHKNCTTILSYVPNEFHATNPTAVTLKLEVEKICKDHLDATTLLNDIVATYLPSVSQEERQLVDTVPIHMKTQPNQVFNYSLYVSSFLKLNDVLCRQLHDHAKTAPQGQATYCIAYADELKKQAAELTAYFKKKNDIFTINLHQIILSIVHGQGHAMSNLPDPITSRPTTRPSKADTPSAPELSEAEKVAAFKLPLKNISSTLNNIKKHIEIAIEAAGNPDPKEVFRFNKILFANEETQLSDAGIGLVDALQDVGVATRLSALLKDMERAIEACSEQAINTMTTVSDAKNTLNYLHYFLDVLAKFHANQYAVLQDKFNRFYEEEYFKTSLRPEELLQFKEKANIILSTGFANEIQVIKMVVNSLKTSIPQQDQHPEFQMDCNTTTMDTVFKNALHEKASMMEKSKKNINKCLKNEKYKAYTTILTRILNELTVIRTDIIHYRDSNSARYTAHLHGLTAKSMKLINLFEGIKKQVYNDSLAKPSDSHAISSNEGPKPLFTNAEQINNTIVAKKKALLANTLSTINNQSSALAPLTIAGHYLNEGIETLNAPQIAALNLAVQRNMNGSLDTLKFHLNAFELLSECLTALPKLSDTERTQTVRCIVSNSLLHSVIHEFHLKKMIDIWKQEIKSLPPMHQLSASDYESLEKILDDALEKTTQLVHNFWAETLPHVLMPTEAIPRISRITASESNYPHALIAAKIKVAQRQQVLFEVLTRPMPARMTESPKNDAIIKICSLMRTESTYVKQNLDAIISALENAMKTPIEAKQFNLLLTQLHQICDAQVTFNEFLSHVGPLKDTTKSTPTPASVIVPPTAPPSFVFNFSGQTAAPKPALPSPSAVPGTPGASTEEKPAGFKFTFKH